MNEHTGGNGMKVIAMIEVPEGGKGKWYIDGEIRYTENKSLMAKFDKEMVPLKPLPQKIDKGMEVDISGGDDYETGYIHGWHRGVDKGWNDCIKTIKGETK